MKVICYGDSNTWGYDPRSWLGDRYAADSRWVDLLAAKTGWDIQNRGLNGRSIPREAAAFPADTGLLVVMLGTNDLLEGSPPRRCGPADGTIPHRGEPGAGQTAAGRPAAGGAGGLGPG